MKEQFSRTGLLIGEAGVQTLQKASVAIFGIGGVGSYVVEALARSGVGNLYLYDYDDICLSNINRQIIATHKTVGLNKVDVMKERVLDINPEAIVEANKSFFGAETADTIDFNKFDYIVDAIDTVSSKLLLAEIATTKGIPIISSMGAGNKLDPTQFEVSDIKKTSVCPLAKVMRKELKLRGIDHLKVVYSKEEVIKPNISEEVTSRRHTPGSVAFVPSVVGLIIAGEVVKDLISK